MKPEFWMDLRVALQPDGGYVSNATRLFQCVHGYFHTHPETYAIALPEMQTGERRTTGPVLRVFAEAEIQLLSLQEYVRKAYRAGQVSISAPMPTSARHNGLWESYVRFRIPNRRSFLVTARERRKADAESLPYFLMVSKTTRQKFSVHIRRATSPRVSDGEPDSYGLASDRAPFAVPVIV